MFFASRFLPTALLTCSTTLGSGVVRRNFNNTTCNKASILDFPIGLGTYGLKPEQVSDAIHSAVQLGYRRIDCAPVYFNEDKIGDALTKELKECGNLSRSDLFIVSKLASPFHRKEHVKIGLQKTLTDLNLDYLDLFLIHWPQAFRFVEIDPNKRGYENEDIDESGGGKLIDPTVSVHETWEAMEELVGLGLVRSLGVSNFPVSLLHELMSKSRIPPAVNQVESHPYLQQTKLLKYCQARGVHFQAYSPLGSPGYIEDEEPRILDDPVLQKIAASHNISVANVCIAWATQRGTSVVVKSAVPERQKENWRTLGSQNNPLVTLSEAEMTAIASLEKGYRFFRPEDWWGDMAMAVFD